MRRKRSDGNRRSTRQLSAQEPKIRAAGYHFRFGWICQGVPQGGLLLLVHPGTILFPGRGAVFSGAKVRMRSRRRCRKSGFARVLDSFHYLFSYARIGLSVASISVTEGTRKSWSKLIPPFLTFHFNLALSLPSVSLRQCIETAWPLWNKPWIRPVHSP